MRSLATPDIVYQRQDARIDLERQLFSEIHALQKEIDLINEQLRSFGKPEGIRSAIIALSYLSLVGVMLPITLMTLRPVPDSASIKVLVLIAFISGLPVLLGYFLFRARSLKPPTD